MALEELRGGDDSARPQLEAARQNFTGMLSGADAQLEQLFAAYDASHERETLSQIRAALNRRKYIENLVAEVQRALESHVHSD
jgi:molecular chaperone HscB